jgi:hypothetical protein
VTNHYNAADTKTQAPIFKQAGTFDVTVGAGEPVSTILSMIPPAVTTHYQNAP